MGSRPSKQLVDRILAEPGGVVTVGIARCQPEDPLGDQLFDGVIDLAGLTGFGHARGHSPDQAETTIGGFQQNRPTVRRRVRLIETGDERLVEQVGEQNSLSCGRLGHAKASRGGKSALTTAFYHAGAFVLSAFVNFPG